MPSKSVTKSIKFLIIAVVSVYVFYNLLSSLSNQHYQYTATNESHHFQSDQLSIPKTDLSQYNGYTQIIQTYSTIECKKPVQILSIVNDRSSWGGGSFHSFLSMLSTIEYPEYCLSVSLLVSDSKEFNSMKTLLSQEHPFSSITLIHQPIKPITNRSDRKEDAVQKERRRLLAILRNQLLFSVIRIQSFAFLWVDSDIIKVPSHTLKKCVDSGKDIIAAMCTKGGGEYDMNSWVGPRREPNSEEWKDIDAGRLFVPRPTKETRFMNEWTNNQSSDKSIEFIELDSVGGTFLFVKAEVHRSGIAFTTNYAVGTGWNRLEGFDGIETEGLCYVAKSAGYKCWGMPYENVVHSTM